MRTIVRSFVLFLQILYFTNEYTGSLTMILVAQTHTQTYTLTHIHRNEGNDGGTNTEKRTKTKKMKENEIYISYVRKKEIAKRSIRFR